MAYKGNYSLFLIDITFYCLECDAHIQHELVLPEPSINFSDDSYGSEEDQEYLECSKCGKGHIIDITCNYDKHYFSCVLRDTQQEISDGVPYYKESEDEEFNWIIGNTEHYEIFREQLNNAEALNRAIDSQSELKHSQNIMLYAHVVAALEGFLGATFIYYVLNHEMIFNKFIQCNKDFAKVTFNIQDFGKGQDPIREHVQKYLNEFIFHKMEKVKPLFKDVLGFDFKDIGWLFKAIIKRHDCVHRAGFTKGNVALNITETDIYELIEKSQDLAVDLNTELSKLENSL